MPRNVGRGHRIGRYPAARAVIGQAMSEDDLLVAVTGTLSTTGWRWVHFRRSDQAKQMGHSGLPDIIAVRDGRLLFIELKSMRGRLTANQEAWLRDLARVGDACPLIDALLVRPSDLDGLIFALAAA